MSKAVGFHIDVKPVSVTFTCPHCGYVECPDCETEVKLGDYEYD